MEGKKDRCRYASWVVMWKCKYPFLVCLVLLAFIFSSVSVVHIVSERYLVFGAGYFEGCTLVTVISCLVTRYAGSLYLYM
jgi:hypothetical protein